MARTPARKTKASSKSKKARKGKARKAKSQKKAASKKKVAKKAEASGVLPAPALRGAMQARLDVAVAVAPDDDAKLLAVGKYVNKFMTDENSPWSDDDLVTKFGYTTISIAGVLSVIGDQLKRNSPQSYTLTITPKLKAKCVSGSETVGQMKFDIDDATAKTKA